MSTLFGGHGIVVPIVLPLVAGALLVVLESARSRWVPALSVAATLALLGVALALLVQAGDGGVQAYLLGNWRAPFGIALALDRLAAGLLLLTAGVGLAALTHALGADDRRGPYFHALFQFQLAGLNGAFLTADLFNLFVFFELLLAASYGLLLHGRGAGQRQRLRAGLHCVVFNLAGSALFLVAASVLYGVTGTLNLADMAVKLPLLGPTQAPLALAGVLMLMVVFAVKAALLPLYFWLPDAYASATASVAALFALLTKVGLYAMARVGTLLLPAGVPGLLPLALATVALAAVGALAATRLRPLVAWLVVGSAGTLGVALGLAREDALAAGLFYTAGSTVLAAAWFLLAERIAWRRGGRDALLPLPWSGRAGPLGTAFFVAAVAVAGLPPLAGFLGKAWLLQAAGTSPHAAWVVAVVLASSLLVTVALARAGSAVFWQALPGGPAVAAAPRAQGLALALLLAVVLGCALAAGPLGRYTAAAAAQLYRPAAYVDAVLGAQPVAPAFNPRGHGP